MLDIHDILTCMSNKYMDYHIIYNQLYILLHNHPIKFYKHLYLQYSIIFNMNKYY